MFYRALREALLLNLFIMINSGVSIIRRKFTPLFRATGLNCCDDGALRGCEIQNKKNVSEALWPVVKLMARGFGDAPFIKIFVTAGLMPGRGVKLALAGLFVAMVRGDDDDDDYIDRPIVPVRISCRDRVIGRDNFDDCSWKEIRECMFKNQPSFRPPTLAEKRPEAFEWWPDSLKSIIAPFRDIDTFFVARVMAPVFLLMLVFIIFSIIVQVSIGAVPRVINKISHESWLSGYERGRGGEKKSSFLVLYFRRWLKKRVAEVEISLSEDWKGALSHAVDFGNKKLARFEFIRDLYRRESVLMRQLRLVSPEFENHWQSLNSEFLTKYYGGSGVSAVVTLAKQIFINTYYTYLLDIIGVGPLISEKLKLTAPRADLSKTERAFLFTIVGSPIKMTKFARYYAFEKCHEKYWVYFEATVQSHLSDANSIYTNELRELYRLYSANYNYWTIDHIFDFDDLSVAEEAAMKKTSAVNAMIEIVSFLAKNKLD